MNDMTGSGRTTAWMMVTERVEQEGQRTLLVRKG